jgi:hypothetical protein
MVTIARRQYAAVEMREEEFHRVVDARSAMRHSGVNGFKGYR